MRKDIEWLKSEVWDMNRNKGLAWKDEVIDLISQVEQSVIPTIPKYMAEYIESRKGRIPLGEIIYLAHLRGERVKLKREFDWIEENIETFIRAWLDGYSVEEDKYLVLNNRNETMLVRMLDGGAITESDAFSVDEMYPSELESHLLTKREVREYDERYLPFMVTEEDLW